MNAPEKNMVRLAAGLFAVGVIVRLLPWGLPSIERFEVGDALVVPVESPVADSSRLLHDEQIFLSKIDSEKTDSVKVSRHQGVAKKQKKVALPVHINTATVDELCALNGVGPKLAEKIVGVRESQGPFKTPSDLKKVPGIGEKKLEKLLSGVNFD